MNQYYPIQKLTKPSVRLPLAIGLLIFELLCVSILVDVNTFRGEGIAALFLSKGGNFLRWIIAAAGVLVLCLAKDYKQRLLILLNNHSSQQIFAALLVHMVSFSVLVYLTIHVFGEQQNPTAIAIVYWVFAVSLTGISWCLIVANLFGWRNFITTEKTSLGIAVIGGALVFALGLFSQQYWASTSDITLVATRVLLEFFYDDIIFDFSLQKIGIHSFWVYIDSACSGIEGMVLAVSTAGLYLYIERFYLRFPRALILLLIACVISFILNIVRIYLLIIIGGEISPQIAVGGFHSVAGWISSAFVALLIVFVFSSWTWFQNNNNRAVIVGQSSRDFTIGIAILLPFIVFAVTNLVGKIFVTGFDYFYPIKVLPVLGTILFFWKQYQFKSPDRLIEAFFAGAIVAILWVFLIPGDAIYNSTFYISIISMPIWLLVGWFIFRIIGFWFVAPILEELVFRGYLLSRLTGQKIDNTSKPVFSFVALVVSSVLFGLMHNAWIAGTVAGLIFAIVRYRSESITNAIAAHSFANLFVSIWAFSSGNWSLL